MTILDYVEHAGKKSPNRIAYMDENEKLTFAEVADTSKQVGNLLSACIEPGQPVVVISERSVWTPVLYFGVLSAGCFYVPVGVDLPIERIKAILKLVSPSVILTDGNCESVLSSLEYGGKVLSLLEAKEKSKNENLDNSIRKTKTLDTDPIYVIFTSGSTGVPKGIIASHRAVIDYVETFVKTFSIDENEVLGCQAAFDYDAAVRDLYIPMLAGAKTVIIPKKMFSEPRNLFAYMNNHQITMICWAASALALCCNYGMFECSTLETVKKVFFIGSVLPAKHLKVWQSSLPAAIFVNHYGPSESTASCTYYTVDHIVNENEVLPIGIPFPNRDVFLLGDGSLPVADGEVGEICIKGSCLALGYYKDKQKTEEVFISNPLKPDYPERIYKTGDLGSFRSDGYLLFHGRADRQVKHMGYRVELDEIEAALLQLRGVDACACVYKNDELLLFYEGSASKKDIAIHLRKILPSYMVPRKIMQIDKIPLTNTGKINYKSLTG